MLVVSFKYIFSAFVFVTFVGFCTGLKGKLSFWEEKDYGGDGHIWTKADNDSLGRIRYTNSGCMLGMWNYVSLGETNSYGLGSAETEECNPEYMFSPSTLKFVRPMASPDTSVVALSLYETHMAFLDMVPEHYFEGAAWMGTPFPIDSLAVTGWSNWTISEFPNYGGRSICIRSTEEFHYINGLHSDYPERAGTVAQGCAMKTDATVYLPQNENGLILKPIY